MPSPIGHMITGAAIGRALRPVDAQLAVLCAAVAAVPDLDLLLPGTHRTVTHSVTTVAVAAIVAIIVTGRVTSARSGSGYGIRSGIRSGIGSGIRPGVRSRIVLAVVGAFASHLLLDWLGADPTPPNGIQLLWPFSDRWFISGLDLFRGTARRNLFTAHSMWINAKAVVQEVAITGPIAWIVWRATSAEKTERRARDIRRDQ